MTKTHKILIGIVVAALAALCYWTVHTVPQPADDASPLEKRVMTYNGNTITEEKDGRKLWELTAESMEVDIDTQDASITNMDAKFYTEDGAHLRADRLEWKAKENQLALIGNAELQRDSDAVKAKGDRIESLDGFNKFKIIGHAHLEKGNK